MTESDRQQRATVPSISELLNRFLTRRSLDAEAMDAPEPVGEVQLYQASDLLAVSPQAAMIDAWEAATRLTGREKALGFVPRRFRPPSEWARLVRRAEPRCLIPCCVGVFPQLVRDASPLLTADLEQWQTTPSSSWEMPEVEGWGREHLAAGRPAEALFAVGMLRIAGQYEAASKLLDRIRSTAPDTWADVLANEQAALLWFLGDLAGAERMWKAHPQSGNGVVLYNRGVTALCQGRKDAIELFDRASAAWPESSTWHHLARMYRTLAETL
ncbi:MAG: hypothetical protein NZM31_05495 [Gemmatales bacterium]|nr:hypothetical protein [Gemmatales bacterium]MDW8386452.1 hypothetical protein [Gemmatales bacterium]